MKKLILFVLGVLLVPTMLWARIYVPVDQPSDKPFPIAITDVLELEGNAGKWSEEISKILRNDLTISGYFRIIPQTVYLDVGAGMTVDTIPFQKWTAIEAGGLVKGTIQKEKDAYTVILKLFDPYDAELLVGKQYTSKEKDLRSVAHRFADEIMLALTGTRGIFNTKIAYAGLMGKSKKSVYVMDVDGENNANISNTKFDFGPAFSPDGSKVAYSAYPEKKHMNPQIFVTTLGKGGARQLTNNKGINITPSWTPDGGTILFSSSIDGPTSIYSMSAGGGKMTPVVRSSGMDIAPRLSKSGGLMVYSSDRSGRLHVFRSSPDGSGALRLTFVGIHNDAPDISPDESKIVFCGQDTGNFDIFIMNSDGTNIQRLTVASGRNEHPRWSPDGRYIVFSSTRDGAPAIYMMRADGSNQIRISKGAGMFPDWSPWLK